MKTIDRTELEQWTREARTFALVDVLPDDPARVQVAGEMPHAHSEGDFMEQMKRLKAHKEQPVVLYEATSASVHACAAAAMLEQAGFNSVYRFVGPQAALHDGGHGAPAQNESA